MKAAALMIIITAILLHQDKAAILLPAVVLVQAAAIQTVAVRPQTVVAVAPVPVDAEDNAKSENGRFNLKNNFS
jgi:hypothetical protein